MYDDSESWLCCVPIPAPGAVKVPNNGLIGGEGQKMVEVWGLFDKWVRLNSSQKQAVLEAMRRLAARRSCAEPLRDPCHSYQAQGGEIARTEHQA